MRRRTFLSVLGVASCGGIGIFLDACADDDAEPARLKDGGAPEPTGTATSTPPVKSTAPTDDNEFVPGSPPDAGSPVVNAALPNAAWEARAKQLEGFGALYTEANPGPWAGKERSHVPTIIADTVLTNRVTVIVNHVMTPPGTVAPPVDAGPPDAAALADADPDADAAPPPPPVDAGPVILPEHYITTIYVKTDTGVVAGLIEFKSNDPSPPSVTFVLPAGTKSVTAYEFCNLHGLWASKPLAVKA
jgi:desulfoferrodoxin (superoxide reductase-like protein)